MTKPTITFTHEQAVDFITEKLQDDFSSNFDFIVSISNINSEIPVASGNNSDNPWLIPDEDGWFAHDPEWKSSNCPSYINKNKKVIIVVRGVMCCTIDESSADYAKSWNWCIDGDNDGDILKWKYV